MAEIPFWFFDRPKWVSGIGRSTTCQDILHSLVKAQMIKERKGQKKNEDDKEEVNPADLDIRAKACAQKLVIVEQWRGVERPLSNSSKILKLWSAWGEERSQVKFVVKRLSSTATSVANATNSLSRSKKTKKNTPRRRNSSRLSNASSLDTLHPKAIMAGSSTGPPPSSTEDIERLMRIILTQGETIHNQLKRLREREGQIETIEEQVHDSRTKTAGKDYLLNAYLREQLSDDSSSNNSKGSTSRRQPKKETSPECVQEMVDALSKVHKLNEQLADAEEKISDLETRLHENQPPNPPARSSSLPPNPASIDSTRKELGRLRSMNDEIGREIDRNRHLISTMQSAFDQRRALVERLEHDVHFVESEEVRLKLELRRANSDLHIQASHHDVDHDDDNEEDEEDEEYDDELLNDLYRLSSSQLYEDKQIYHHRSSNGRGAASISEGTSKNHLSIRTRSNDPPGPSTVDTARHNATGSPGSTGSSSSSTSASSGCGTGSEKSVRFSDRDLILATPELPPLPQDEDDTRRSTKRGSLPHGISQLTKSILKAVDPSGDLDSNSDTGLSSLHSSSDEGTYVLDTLV